MYIKNALVTIIFGLFPLNILYAQTAIESDSIIREESSKSKSPDNFKGFIEESKTLLNKIKEKIFFNGNKSKSNH